jgi:hypothetical protein
LVDATRLAAVHGQLLRGEPQRDLVVGIGFTDGVRDQRGIKAGA